jgi:hypothetical protein
VAKSKLQQFVEFLFKQKLAEGDVIPFKARTKDKPKEKDDEKVKRFKAALDKPYKEKSDV